MGNKNPLTKDFHFRKETINKEWQSTRSWTAKFDPWFIDEYRQVGIDFLRRMIDSLMINDRCMRILLKFMVFLVQIVLLH